jgi:hypothetical protein
LAWLAVSSVIMTTFRSVFDDHRCHYDAEECGKEFACITHISLEEVSETVMKLV